MPIYATAQDLVAFYGPDAVAVASDNSNIGTINLGVVTEGLRSASAEIEFFAGPYGAVPTDVGPQDAATPGTFPEWWREACKDIAIYAISRDGGTYSKQIEKRYHDWRELLMLAYPPKVDGATVTNRVTLFGGPREFSAEKVRGL